ncbi:MAG TPA: hypothetical protein VF868_00370 [Bacteroidia bacterium]
METNAKKLSIVLITLATAFMSCTKEKIRPMQESTAVATPHNLDDDKETKPANWVISSLYSQKTGGVKDTENKAGKFTGWTFVFENGGMLYATNGTKRVNGKWYRGERNELRLSFGDVVPFNELNNSWTVVRHSPSVKILEDKNASDGMTGSLMFEVKNK